MAPATRRPADAPRLTVEHAPAYELLHSLVIAVDRADADTYEIGVAWLDEARSRAGDELLARVETISFGDADTFRHLMGLAYDAPAPRDTDALLEHLRATDPLEIKLHIVQYYSRDTRRMTAPSVIRAAVAGDAEAAAEFLRTSNPDWEPWTSYLRAVLDADADRYKAELIDVIGQWAERVWKPESLTIMPIIERDAEAKRELLRDVPIEEFVRTATNGVEYTPRPGVDRLVMVPSFLNRPIITFAELGEVFLVFYPVADEHVGADAGAPPLRLVRLSKALGDEKRLRILRALADGEKSLMELAEMFGVAKTTMHHHMIVLRSAGLISVAAGSKRYRLRSETVPDVGALLSGYLGAATGPSAASGAPAAAEHRTG